MSNVITSRPILFAALVAVATFLLTPMRGPAQNQATGFNGYIRSGSCAKPAGNIHLDISRGTDQFAFLRYTAPPENGVTDTGPVTYFGIRTVPGFGVLTLLSGEPYAVVITADSTDTIVACGDIHRPTQSAFQDSGVVLVRLDPVGNSTARGVAILRSASLSATQGETLAEVILTVGTAAGGAATPAAGATPPAAGATPTPKT